MKRPPQLWVLSIGILCLSLLPSTRAVRATSLIFAKTTTTTTTTVETSADDDSKGVKEEAVTVASESSADGNQTKPTLTGIPQIDYIWDPNLPFELRGYNLSDYPFYDRVPEEIDFKCDGLHDGFYASVPHKCQVYHHCLFGTRYDFLCANFTAFDQKTFICHFVSEVDCNNSKKFWHRNDALYKAATTTAAPTTTSIPFTPSPALNPALRRPSPALAQGGGRRRPPYRRRRPVYYDEEDEDYYYYDDLPVRRRNRRPRPVKKQEDYDEVQYDDEYEDSRYDRRNTGRRDEDKNRRPYDGDEDDRRTYDRREEDRRYVDRRPVGSGKNKDRRVEDDDRRRPIDDRRRPSDDRRADDDYDRRPYDRPRKSSRDRYEDALEDDRRYNRPRKSEDDRRPFDRPRKTDNDRRYRPKDTKSEEDDRRYRPSESKPEDEDRRYRTKDTKQDEDDDRRYKPKDDDDRRYRPKNSKDEDERRYRPTETKTQLDDKDDRRFERPVRKPVEDERRWRPKDSKNDERARPTEETKLLIKPNSGSSIYDRPRAPPIIRRPVPLNEKEKYDYKPSAVVAKPTVSKVEEEEYYDDYEEEPKLPPTKPTRKPVIDSRESDDRRVYSRPRRPQFSVRKPIDEPEEDLRRPLPKRPLDRSQERPSKEERPLKDQVRPVERQRDQDKSLERLRDKEQIRPRFEPINKKPPPVEEEEYIDEYEDEKSSSKQENTSKELDIIKSNSKEVRDQPAKLETTSKEVTSRERERRPEPIVKIVKRPFLPSRGGDPFTPRGLQPVGSKALDLSNEKPEKSALKDDVSQSQSQSQEQQDNAPRSQENLKQIKPFLRSSSQENDQFVKRPVNREEILIKRPTSQEETNNKSVEKPKQTSDEYYDDEEFKPVTSRPKGDFRNFNLPRTTQKPKVPDNYRNPLDINENEYDVTLNDALNPTLPNLPVRSVPTGFSNGRDTYIAQSYQRPRLVAVENPILSPASSDFVYQVKQPRNVQQVRYNPYVTVQQYYRQSPVSTAQYYTT